MDAGKYDGLLELNYHYRINDSYRIKDSYKIKDGYRSKDSERRDTMSYRVTLIPGDGTGPELAAAARRVLDATGVAIEWEEHQAGAEVMEKEGTPLPPAVLESIRRNKVALKGPSTTPIGTGFRSVNVALRHELDLFACVRPCKSIPGIRSPYANVDIVVIRENTEDLYAGVEYEAGSAEARKIIEMAPAGKIREDAAISIKPISRSGSERIIRYAFEYAKKNNRRKVTAVAKANIMKYTDGLFYHVGREIAGNTKGWSSTKKSWWTPSACALAAPESFDVLVLPTFTGISSPISCRPRWRAGSSPGANIGDGWPSLSRPTVPPPNIRDGQG